jgi:hypothetical protein
MFFVQTSTLPQRMHPKLTKCGRLCKQYNHLPTKSHDIELEDNSNVNTLFDPKVHKDCWCKSENPLGKIGACQLIQMRLRCLPLREVTILMVPLILVKLISLGVHTELREGVCLDMVT